jgi:thiosulfate/3-mercaptopyruvate sulfurtransferase
VDLSRPVVTSCGSGVTAAVLSLALQRIGHTDHALYDGSWAEWGMYGDLGVATGR